MKKLLFIGSLIVGLAIYLFTRKKAVGIAVDTSGNLFTGFNFPVSTGYTSTSTSSSNSGSISNGSSSNNNDANALTSEVRQIAYLTAENLNQVDLTNIDEFDIPLHPNPTYPNEPVFKCFMNGPNYRSQSTVGNIFKKGFTGVEWGLMQMGTEKQEYPFNPNFISTIPREKRVIYYRPPQNLNLDVNASGTDIMNTPYSAYNYIGGEMVGNIAKMFEGNADKVHMGLVYMDIENGIWTLNDQELANRLVAIYEQIHSGCDQYTKVSLLYQALPIHYIGFGVSYDDYGHAPSAFWTLPATMTTNASSMGMPVENVGKSLNSLNYIKCVFEYYLYYEAFQEQGTILKNILDENLKDGSGNDISMLDHFDESKPSYLHFASHLTAGIEVNKPWLNGKSLLIQTNNFNMAGIGYYYRDYGQEWTSQPNSNKLKQSNDGLGRYAIPSRIMEAMTLLSYFSGCEFYNWNDSRTLTPVNRSTGEYVNGGVVRTDYSNIDAEQIAIRRLSVEKAIVGNNQYSVADLIDGSEIYTCDNTKVDYLNVSTFSGVRAVKGLDFRKYKLSAVRCIVNEAKGLIAILAFQPYSCEQSTVDVIYNSNGYNFRKTIQIPVGQNKIYIYSLNS